MQEIQGMVFDIRKFSLHDGPGIRTTVFFKGCPLSCLWCHNPESQSSAQELMLWDSRCVRCERCLSACPLSAIQRLDGRVITDRAVCTIAAGCEAACAAACAADARQVVGVRMSAEAVMREVERERPFYEESGGGATFSGGEPLAQPAFLAELLRRSKALDIHTALDTSGLAPWRVIDGLREIVDVFLYDLKAFDDARHRRLTGVSNRQILRNLRRLSELGQRIIVRVPVIPGVNDDPRDLQALIDFTAALPHLERVDLLPFHPTAAGKYERLGRANPLLDLKSPSAGYMEELAGAFQQRDLLVQIGG